MGDIAPREEKEKNMKKLVAFLIILAVVMTGVFANGGLAFNQSAEVKLEGKIGAHFEHGVVGDNNILLPGKVFERTDDYNALRTEGTSFAYGFKSNKTINGKLYMKVSNFINDGDGDKTIQIKKVQVGQKSNGQLITHADYGIEIFSNLDSTDMTLTSQNIQIIAAQEAGDTDYASGEAVSNHVGNAGDGNYTATLTFSIVTSD